MLAATALVVEHDPLAKIAAEHAEAVGEGLDRVGVGLGGGEVAEQTRVGGERVVAQPQEALAAGAVGGGQEGPAQVRGLVHGVGLDPAMAGLGDFPDEVERDVGHECDPLTDELESDTV